MRNLFRKDTQWGRWTLFFVPLSVLLLYILGGAFLFKVCHLSPIVGTLVMDGLMSAACGLYVYRFQPCVQGDGKSFLKLPMKYVMWFLLMFVWVFGQITSAWVLDLTGDSAFHVYQDTLSGNTAMWLSVLLTVVAAPVCEELMLRGVVQDCWSRINPWLGLIGSALLFSLMHGTLVHLPSTFMMGLMTSVVYAATGRMGLAILLHVGYNGAVSVLGKLTLPSFLFTPAVFITIDVLLVVWMLFEYRYVLGSMKKKEDCHGEAKETQV